MSAVDLSLRQCGECGVLVPGPDGSGPVPCPSCGTSVLLSVFPAIARSRLTGTAEALTSADDASCFFHEDKRAAAACDSCGRFLCFLCDLPWGSRTLCPTCVVNAEQNTTLLVRERTLNDSIALAIAGFSIILLQLSFVTLPAALFFAIRSFRTPGSLVRRTRIRSWIAICLAIAQFAGWTWLITYVILSVPR